MEEQRQLAAEMLDFVRSIPASAGLEWVKDPDYLYYFEAERLLAARALLSAGGVLTDAPLRVLDFGFLHGLLPEFLHRFFPRATITVFDHPNSPNFRNPEYQALIRSRDYLRLEPVDLAEIGTRSGQYDLIVLGEIIEHLDPTVAAKAFQALRNLLAPEGRLLITTPNGAGVKNLFYSLLAKDAQHPPVPDATMNYGHIHLWSPHLLGETLRLCGWSQVQECFTHGFERWHRGNADRHWGSLKHQIATRALFALASWRPAWRGFFLTLWRRAEHVPPATVSFSSPC